MSVDQTITSGVWRGWKIDITEGFEGQRYDIFVLFLDTLKQQWLSLFIPTKFAVAFCGTNGESIVRSVYNDSSGGFHVNT